MSNHQPERVYFVYDGRAAFGDTDRAIVLVTADSLEEAIEDRKYFGDSVVYSYATGGKYLTDKRLEITLDGTVLSRMSADPTAAQNKSEAA